jgi:hypothetical protein
MRLPDPPRFDFVRRFTHLEDERGARAAGRAILQRTAAALSQPRVPIAVLQFKGAQGQKDSKSSADPSIGFAPD